VYTAFSPRTCLLTTELCLESLSWIPQPVALIWAHFCC